MPATSCAPMAFTHLSATTVQRRGPYRGISTSCRKLRSSGSSGSRLLMVSHTADEAKAANVAAMGEQVGRVVVNVISLAITGGTSLYSVPSGFSGVDPTGQPNDDFETSRWRVISCFR